MSWKSLVTASLLCVLASPAFAVPSLTITSGGLNASGNWVWNVAVAPSTTTTPVATEIGFTTVKDIVSVTNAAPGTWDTSNPGNVIFGSWQTNANGALFGSPLAPEGLEADCTGCVLTNATTNGGNQTKVVSGTLNQIFAALGSGAIAAPTGYLTITTAGPTDTSLTSSITLSGSYTRQRSRVGNHVGSNPTNYKGFTGVATRTVVPGDANLSGLVARAAAVTLAD